MTQVPSIERGRTQSAVLTSDRLAKAARALAEVVKQILLALGDDAARSKILISSTGSVRKLCVWRE